MAPATEALIDPEHAAFMTGAVSISVGSRDADHLPNLTRAFGCRVSADRRRVTVFVSTAQSRDVLADLRTNGAVAAVFTQPATHRTVQFKGRDAAVEPLADGDLARIERYREAFVAHLVPLGFSDLAIRMLVDCPAHELAAIAFTPCAAFSQTPGPHAGTPLERPR